MSGTVTVTKTRDWLTPYEVRLEPETGKGQPSTSRFSAAAKAQTYALAIAEEWEATLVYRTEEPEQPLDVMGVPTNGGNPKTSRLRAITPEEFQRRFPRICSKCKQSKPLTEFGHLTHRNRTTRREVFHGYTKRCLDCGGDDE